MTNYGIDKLSPNHANEGDSLSEELAQKFDELLYTTGEELEMFVKPDSLQTEIVDIPFGRYNDGTISVGSTSSETAHDGFVAFTHSEDPEQSFDARSATRLNLPGWSVDGGKRWSNRRLLGQIEFQWPVNDDSAAHGSARTLSQNAEAEKDLDPARIVELVENYALLNELGDKSLVARWNYGGTIHSGPLGGSKRVKSTFRLEKNDKNLGMSKCRFEMSLPITIADSSVTLTYSVQRDEVGAITMRAEYTHPSTELNSRIEIQDPETVYECLQIVARNMIEDKVHDAEALS